MGYRENHNNNKQKWERGENEHAVSEWVSYECDSWWENELRYCCVSFGGKRKFVPLVGESTVPLWSTLFITYFSLSLSFSFLFFSFLSLHRFLYKFFNDNQYRDDFKLAIVKFLLWFGKRPIVPFKTQQYRFGFVTILLWEILYEVQPIHVL